MRLASHQHGTITRAASSALFFIVFLTKTTDMKIERESLRVEKLMEEFVALDQSSRTSVLVRFLSWYGEIPPSRVSSTKLIAAQNDRSRSYSKTVTK